MCVFLEPINTSVGRNHFFPKLLIRRTLVLNTLQNNIYNQQTLGTLKIDHKLSLEMNQIKKKDVYSVR